MVNQSLIREKLVERARLHRADVNSRAVHIKNQWYTESLDKDLVHLERINKQTQHQHDLTRRSFVKDRRKSMKKVYVLGKPGYRLPSTQKTPCGHPADTELICIMRRQEERRQSMDRYREDAPRGCFYYGSGGSRHNRTIPPTGPAKGRTNATNKSRKGTQSENKLKRNIKLPEIVIPPSSRNTEDVDKVHDDDCSSAGFSHQSWSKIVSTLTPSLSNTVSQIQDSLPYLLALDTNEREQYDKDRRSQRLKVCARLQNAQYCQARQQVEEWLKVHKTGRKYGIGNGLPDEVLSEDDCEGNEIYLQSGQNNSDTKHKKCFLKVPVM